MRRTPEEAFQLTRSAPDAHVFPTSDSLPMEQNTRPLPPGYELVEGRPNAANYCVLRAATGLSPKTEEQARIALAGTWYMCYITHTKPITPGDGNPGTSFDSSGEPSEVVAMGRVIGDGGWYFIIADIATLPEHQRQGLGDAIMPNLLGRIRSHAPPGAFVTLLADPPGRRLYERHGFKETALYSPYSAGMTITL